MSSKSATVLVIFVVAILGLCCAYVFAGITQDLMTPIADNGNNNTSLTVDNLSSDTSDSSYSRDSSSYSASSSSNGNSHGQSSSSDSSPGENDDTSSSNSPSERDDGSSSNNFGDSSSQHD